MKKTYLGIGIIVLVLLVIGGFWLVSRDNEINADPGEQITQSDAEQSEIETEIIAVPEAVEESAQIAPELCVVEEGESYFEVVRKKSLLGEVINTNEKFDFSKLGFEQSTPGKKVLLTFSNSGCSGCQKFYPLFKEWVERFSDKLDVRAVLYGSPSTNDRIKQELVDAGITTVTTADLDNLVDPEYQKYESLLIDENGILVYGLYSFDIPKWKLAKEIIDTFVTTGEVVEQKLDYVFKGKKLNFPTMTDLSGREYTTQDFVGKPTLFFVNWPHVRLNQQAYSVVNNIYARYKDNINVALVLYDNESVTGRMTKEYYDTYNIESNFTDNAIKDINSLIVGHGLEDKPVFFDQEWEFYNYSSLEATPSVFVCDENLNVVNILSLGRCIAVTASGDLTVEQVVKDTFNIK